MGAGAGSEACPPVSFALFSFPSFLSAISHQQESKKGSFPLIHPSTSIQKLH